MKTTNKLIIIVAALLMFGWTTACDKNAETKNSAANQPAANNTANANQPAANANQPAANKPETPAADANLSPGNSMNSPTETYKVFYAAKQKKDIEGLKKVLSKDALKFFTMMGDGKTENGLKQLADSPQAKTAESRNEKINGDKATLEYLDEKGGWSPMDFVKEDGSWKLDVPDADPKSSDDKKSDDKKSEDKKVEDKKQQ